MDKQQQPRQEKQEKKQGAKPDYATPNSAPQQKMQKQQAKNCETC